MRPSQDERRTGPARRWKDLAAPIAVALSVGALLGTVTAAGGHFGLTVDDVPKKLDRVERASIARDSIADADRALLKLRVGRLEDQLPAIAAALRDMQETQHLQALTSCIVAQRVVREAVPQACGDVIRRGTP